MLEKVFRLKENGTNARTEIIAGITTFMTMAYILAVNPSVLADAGMDQGAVFYGYGTCRTDRNASDGILCQLSFCAGAGDGIKCLLRLHSGSGHGLPLGSGADGSFY